MKGVLLPFQGFDRYGGFRLSKLPMLQFYVGDWRRSADVQSHSYHDKGVWFELLCFMHESERRGKLMLNGKAMPDDAICRLLGLDKQVGLKTIHGLLESGVASRCPETGALMCRRMVRDEALRKVRAEAGKKGGNPILLKQIPTTQVNQIPEDENEDAAKDLKEEKGCGEKPPDPPGQQLSDFGKRVAGWFRRRESTVWNDRELKALKVVEASKPAEDEILLVEKRYLAGDPYLRKDILTLLNNWNGEVDRARKKAQEPTKDQQLALLSNKPESTFEMSKRQVALEELMKNLKDRFSSETATGRSWSDPAKKEAFRRFKTERDELVRKLAGV